MKMTIESTDKVVHLNGVPARVWEGKSESGTPCIAFVTRIAVLEGLKPETYREFEGDLRECRQLSPEAQSIPSRLVL